MKMADLSNTQFFKVKSEPELQVKQVLDIVYNRWLYYVWRSYLYYQLQRCAQSHYESRA